MIIATNRNTTAQPPMLLIHLPSASPRHARNIRPTMVTIPIEMIAGVLEDTQEAAVPRA